jgi:hypothetical protein
LAYGIVVNLVGGFMVKGVSIDFNGKLVIIFAENREIKE